MKKSYKVIVSKEAAQNIEEAYLWISQFSEKEALRWYEGIIAALKSLAKMPPRCSVAPETELGLVEREIRQLLYGKGHRKYRILFAVSENEVLIAHVRHGARLHLGLAASEISEE